MVSAAASGPRYGPPPPGGYDGLDNLFLLCSVCHRIVDTQPASFPPEALHAMKADHEGWVAQQIETGDLPVFSYSLTPAPAELHLSLIASGRQLVSLVSNADDLVTDHDSPRSVEDAELIASVFDRLGDSDVDLEAGGPGASVRLGQDYQRLITEELLPAGIVLYGAVADRQIVVGGVGTPWRSCVVTARYAPRVKHRPEGRSEAAADLIARLRELLASGTPLVESAKVSMDGSSARVEMWEQEVVTAFVKADRADLVTRFEARDPYDFGRSLVSGVWQTRARMRRELHILGEVLAELE